MLGMLVHEVSGREQMAPVVCDHKMGMEPPCSIHEWIRHQTSEQRRKPLVHDKL